MCSIGLTMITVEHSLIGQQIAQELGMTSDRLFLTGMDLDRLPPDELIDRVQLWIGLMLGLTSIAWHNLLKH